MGSWESERERRKERKITIIDTAACGVEEHSRWWMKNTWAQLQISHRIERNKHNLN